MSVEAVARLLARPPAAGEGDDVTDAPYRIFNIGCGRRVELLDYIRALEAAFGREAELQLLPMQPGDMEATMADVSRLERVTGYRPSTRWKKGSADLSTGMSPITASRPPGRAATVGEIAVAADSPPETAGCRWRYRYRRAAGAGGRRGQSALARCARRAPAQPSVVDSRLERHPLALSPHNVGPFWTVLSTATLVGALGFVNAVLWNISISTYLPYFCAGYISWLLFQTIIIESCSSIIASEAIVKVVRVPYSVFIFRVLTRNVDRLRA